LGLAGEQFIPGLLEALHGIIPSSRNLFDWTDSQGNLIRYYFEGPIDAQIARLYFEEFHNRREAEVMPAFRDGVTGRVVVRSAAELNNAVFFRSALYNEIWRPQRLHSRLEAVVHSTFGTPLGSLVLYRERRDRAFTAEEEKLLGLLVPYIARGLETAASSPPPNYVSRRSRRASLTLSSAGELIYASEEAHKLLLLSHGGISPESVSKRPEVAQFPSLRLLVEQINRNQGVSHRRVSVTVDNAWGRFLLEGEPLLSAGGSAGVAIHVGVEHQEPTPIAWRRALDLLPLTVVQKEVCALLRIGYTRPQISVALSIAPNTVTDHIRKIYNKLDVHSVSELCGRLDEALSD
jgi:DNA-binding CsgD family transcriptional regulator